MTQRYSVYWNDSNGSNPGLSRRAMTPKALWPEGLSEEFAASSLWSEQYGDRQQVRSFMISGLGFGVCGLGFQVWSSGFGVWCLGVAVWGLRFSA